MTGMLLPGRPACADPLTERLVVQRMSFVLHQMREQIYSSNFLLE